MRQIPIILLIFILSACRSIIPATTPPQLEYTPDTGIIISDETIVTDSFQVDYPDGWRVVKISIAGEPIELVMVSSDESMKIKIYGYGYPYPESTPEPGTYERFEWVTQGDVTLTIIGWAYIEKREIFDEIYQHVLDSIEIH